VRQKKNLSLSLSKKRVSLTNIKFCPIPISFFNFNFKADAAANTIKVAEEAEVNSTKGAMASRIGEEMPALALKAIFAMSAAIDAGSFCSTCHGLRRGGRLDEDMRRRRREDQEQLRSKAAKAKKKNQKKSKNRKNQTPSTGPGAKSGAKKVRVKSGAVS
jgi:hypothetical protein